uniref:Uncharacterized protein n=1 Tax=Ciona savignyi TaxID=51511 RepID=H2ZNE6_CIOSA
MTHRLSQLGRLSKHDSTVIWDEIKTKLDSALEEIKQGMCTAEDRLKLKYRDHWKQLLLKFEKRKSKLVKNLLDVKKAKTISAFIEGYIDLYLQLAEHQSHNIQDANSQEIVDLAEVQKKRRQLHTLKSKEAESYLWEMLQASGALSNEEI